MRSRTLCILAATVVFGACPLVAVAGGHKHGKPRQACDVTSCTLGAALEATCPCDGATTHGEYVRCVAHAARKLASSGVIARRCRGRVVSMAAHSVCGRADPVVCLLPTSSCDEDGACTDDPSIDCVDDTDCGTSCVLTSADDCDAGNGLTADVGSCVFAGCSSPSGAFLNLER